MSRGPSKNQQAFIAALKRAAAQGKQWCDVGSLMFQVRYGLDCWESSKVLPELTEAERQIYWRSIRLLERRGLVVSRKVLADSRLPGAALMKELALSA